MILCSKLKNGLEKIATKSHVGTKFNITKSRLHCIFFESSEEKQHCHFKVSYWPILILHNCLYSCNGFYMGDSEGMALECEPNGLSIVGQYQCLFSKIPA